MSAQLSAMDATPKQVLLRFYEAEANYMKAYEEDGSASFDEMARTIDPEVVLHQSPELPFGGEYVGYKGYEQWAEAMASIFDKLEVSEREFFERGDKADRRSRPSRLPGAGWRAWDGGGMEQRQVVLVCKRLSRVRCAEPRNRPEARTSV